MNEYHVHLSMGHTTPLQFYGTYAANTEKEARDMAWEEAQEYFGEENLEKAFSRKGTRYLPYYFIQQIHA